MDPKYCIGCRDNFYNGNNSLGVKECWGLKSASRTTRYELSTHIPMNQKSGYHKRRIPNCYHKQGSIFLKQIPDYAK